MTPFVHWLIRLSGHEDWNAWGDDWWAKVDKITELSFIHDQYWNVAPEWLLSKPNHKVEWGAHLYEVTPDEIAHLLSRPRAESGAMMQESWQKQQDLIRELDP